MRFHDLRHTAATLMLRAGVDAHRVQRILRHASVTTTTGTYGHLALEDLRNAVARIGPKNPAPFADIYTLCDDGKLAHVRIANAIRVQLAAVVAFLGKSAR
jgi:hypothetical protein